MNNAIVGSPWFAGRPRTGRAALRLFCFPYAGGGAPIFHGWPQQLPPDIEVLALQPPGRGARLREAPFTRIAQLADAVAGAVAPYLDRPVALFGHSMGALVAFELARRLETAGVPPLHLFVSGRRAPHLPPERPALHPLPEAEFRDELRRLNGTPAEVLEHAELMEMMVPILRADFEAVETYTCHDAPPLTCPVTAFGGEADPDVEPDALAAWEQHTTGRFAARMFPGDHFFLNHPQTQAVLLGVAAQELRNGLGGG